MEKEIDLIYPTSYSPTPVPLVFLFVFCLLERLGEQFIGFSLQKVVLSDKSLGELVAQCELKFVIGRFLFPPFCRYPPPDHGVRRLS